jgi:hypothetical protein
MKTKTREIVIKSIAEGVFYGSIEYGPVYGKKINKEVYYVYEIETNSRLNLDALEHVITESVKVPEGLDEWMEVNGVGKSEIVEFLNKNYKSE